VWGFDLSSQVVMGGLPHHGKYHTVGKYESARHCSLKRPKEH
jgi:hypothetical protein